MGWHKHANTPANYRSIQWINPDAHKLSAQTDADEDSAAPSLAVIPTFQANTPLVDYAAILMEEQSTLYFYIALPRIERPPRDAAPVKKS